MKLTSQNYTKGFLVDADLNKNYWMGGVSESESMYLAFVVSPHDGTTIAQTYYTDLESALKAMNPIRLDWQFEATGGCGEGSCENGSCGLGACGTKECPEVCEKFDQNSDQNLT